MCNLLPRLKLWSKREENESSGMSIIPMVVIASLKTLEVKSPLPQIFWRVGHPGRREFGGSASNQREPGAGFAAGRRRSRNARARQT